MRRWLLGVVICLLGASCAERQRPFICGTPFVMTRRWEACDKKPHRCALLAPSFQLFDHLTDDVDSQSLRELRALDAPPVEDAEIFAASPLFAGVKPSAWPAVARDAIVGGLADVLDDDAWLRRAQVELGESMALSPPRAPWREAAWRTILSLDHLRHTERPPLEVRLASGPVGPKHAAQCEWLWDDARRALTFAAHDLDGLPQQYSVRKDMLPDGETVLRAVGTSDAVAGDTWVWRDGHAQHEHIACKTATAFRSQDVCRRPQQHVVDALFAMSVDQDKHLAETGDYMVDPGNLLHDRVLPEDYAFVAFGDEDQFGIVAHRKGPFKGWGDDVWALREDGIFHVWDGCRSTSLVPWAPPPRLPQPTDP